MGEMNNRSVLQIRGPFEHSSGFPCDSMSAESTDEILSEFSGQFRDVICIRGSATTSDQCDSLRIPVGNLFKSNVSSEDSKSSRYDCKLVTYKLSETAIR